jgi:hypothetical protein
MTDSVRHPDVLSATEATTFLRLHEATDSPEAARALLYRLARQGRISPLRWGKRFLFHKATLDKFVADELAGLNQSEEGTEGERGTDDENAASRVNGHLRGHLINGTGITDDSHART